MDRTSKDDGQSGARDFPDFAQEFLRRNAMYKEQYDQLCCRNGNPVPASASRRMARSWGLEFPVRSSIELQRCASLLECASHRQHHYLAGSD